jgi:hypothetical protein
MNNEPILFFDIRARAHRSLREAPQLRAETLELVAGFTFIWILFDGISVMAGYPRLGGLMAYNNAVNFVVGHLTRSALIK